MNKKKIHLELDSWNPEVKRAVNAFVDGCGNRSEHYDPTVYVVSDSDNTISIFDVEHMLAVYQLQVMAFACKPQELRPILLCSLSDLQKGRTGFTLDGKPHSYLEWADDIIQAYQVLYDHYGPFQTEGLNPMPSEKIQQDPYWLEFAAKMRAMYSLVSQEEPDISGAWLLYWFTGMNEKDVYDLAVKSHQFYAAEETAAVTWTSPQDISSKIGQACCTWTSGISVTENIRELFEVLHNNGIAVWVCSASGMEPIKAEMDLFGLHPSINGLMAMTVKMENGLYTHAYDFDVPASIACKDGTWKKDDLPQAAMTQAEGKVKAIDHILKSRYGHGPAAVFGDSSGDYLMGTIYDSLKLMICFNRADRSVYDGGSLLAEMAVHQADDLHLDYNSCTKKGDTFYVLQGRNENGLRSLRSSRKTIRFGNTEEKLFKDERNIHVLHAMKHMSVKEAFDHFSRKTEDYGFQENAAGYHSRH